MTEMPTADTTPTVQPERHGRRRARLSAVLAGMRPVLKVGRTLPVVLTLVVVGLAGSASPAAAYTQITGGSYPGAVTSYQIKGSHYWTGFAWSPRIDIPGSLVYRSPASSGTQKIVVLHELYVWTGSSWSFVTRDANAAYLYAGYRSIWMPNVDFLPMQAARYFKVITAVAWSNPDGSRAFGSRAIDFNGFDYGCQYNLGTRFVCTTGNGWVYLGAAI